MSALFIGICFLSLYVIKSHKQKLSNYKKKNSNINASPTQLEEEPFEQTNPDFVDGHNLFEKDIMLTETQWEKILARKGLADETRRWPEDSSGTPRVRYRFADSQFWFRA